MNTYEEISGESTSRTLQVYRVGVLLNQKNPTRDKTELDLRLVYACKLFSLLSIRET